MRTCRKTALKPANPLFLYKYLPDGETRPALTTAAAAAYLLSDA